MEVGVSADELNLDLERDRPPVSYTHLYVNMYFVNGGIILPSFGFDQDIEALNILSRELPDRRIVQIDVYKRQE